MSVSTKSLIGYPRHIPDKAYPSCTAISARQPICPNSQTQGRRPHDLSTSFHHPSAQQYSPSHRSRLLLLRRVRNPQHKVNHHRKKQNDSQEGRTKPVIETSLAPHPYRLRPPMVRYEGVYHGGHSDAGEQKGRDKCRAVTEIQHADGQGAEDDGEVEPGEEGPLVGEEDFGLDAGRERNALACGGAGR